MTKTQTARLLVSLVTWVCMANASPAMASADAVPGAKVDQPTAVDRPEALRPSPPLAAGTTVETWDPRLGAALAALAIKPTASSHRAVAAEYVRLKIRDTAHDHLTRALQLDPKDAASYEARARVWRDFGFPEAGLPDGYRARAYSPASAEVANTMGTLFEAMGQFNDALQWYERALALKPGAWFALNNICHVYIRQGRAVAIDACEAAFRAAPAHSNVALNNLALAYAVSGDFERARLQFEAESNRAFAAYNMGIVYMAAQQFARAAVEFRTAWRADPSMGIAVERLRQATARLGTD